MPGRSKLDKKRGYLLYTAIFAILFALCFFIRLVLLMHRSPIRRSDGLEQHFICFVLVGRWIRSLFTGSFGMWSDSMGLGGDMFTSMFGAFTDPMYWLSALVPERYAEYVFDLMIVLKVYLSGLSFMAFCFFRKNKVWPSLAGAIVYTFSASMYLAFFESVCISWMYVLPILMIGTIRLWEKNKPGLFIGALTFTFISQFYFGYMCAMVVLGYCIVRAVIELLEKKETFKAILMKALRFMLFAGLSVGMATVSFLPVIKLLIASDRRGVEYYMPVLYDARYYCAFLAGFSSYFNMLGRDCYLGFSVAALVCVIALFLLGKGRGVLKAGFVLLTVGLCVPFIGHVMNVMSYPSNRWVWAYVMCVSYIVTVTLPGLGDLSWAKRGILLAICAVYGYFSWTLNDGFAPGAEYTYMRPEFYKLAGIGVFAIALLLLLTSCFFKKAYPYTAVTLIGISVIIPAYITFHPEKRNLFGDEIHATTAYEKVIDGGLTDAAKTADPSDGERMEAFGIYNVRNATWVTGVNSTDFYMNVCNNYVESFMREVGLAKSPWAGGYTSFDSRAELEALMGINYVVTPADNFNSVSFGYDQAGTDVYIHDADAVIHPSVLGTHSIASFMDKSISYEDYLTLDMQQRQQALMQAVVVDGGYADSSVKDLDISDDTVEWTIESLDGLRKLDDGFVADIGQASMVISMDTVRNANLYVAIEGLDFDNGHDLDAELFFTAVSDEGEDIYTRNRWFINNRNHMYGGITDWIVNLGSVTEDCSKIRVVFSRPGTYKITSIKIYARDIDLGASDISALDMAASPSDISFDQRRNTYSMHIDSDKDQYLFLAIPYSEGWTMTVNGEKTDILRADTGFMAVYLKPGSYDILLKYKTPGLTAGLGISLLSAILCAGVIFWEKKTVKQGKVADK